MTDHAKTEFQIAAGLIAAVVIVLGFAHFSGINAKIDATHQEEQREQQQKEKRDEANFQIVFHAPARLKGEDGLYQGPGPDPQEVAVRSSRVQEVLGDEVQEILQARADLQHAESDRAGGDYQVQADRAKNARKRRDELVATFIGHVSLAKQFSYSGLYYEIADMHGYIDWCFVSDRFKHHSIEGRSFFEDPSRDSSCY